MRVRHLFLWIWSAARSGSDAMGMLAARGGGEGRGGQGKERHETQVGGPARIRRAVG